MSRDSVRVRIECAVADLMSRMKPDRPCTIHTMLATNMTESYAVYLAWYEGKTKYSVIQHYDAIHSHETPEAWVGRALRAEVAGRGEQIRDDHEGPLRSGVEE